MMQEPVVFRGEPVAYKTLLIGYLFYIITILFGISMPQVLNFNVNLLYQNHYISAFYGFIGLIILGAQLQFFRAIAAVRKYQPANLRIAYLVSLVGGLILMIVGGLFLLNPIITVGYILYFGGAMIHTYWIWNAAQSDLFKFPLNYLRASHFFFLAVLVLNLPLVLDRPTILAAENFDSLHILGVGWISLSLQGAITRVLPMFTGNVIDRTFRRYIDTHYYFSLVASIITSLGFYLSLNVLLLPGLIMWIFSWIWIVTLVIRSVLLSGREVDFPFTFVMFATGIAYMAIGAILGIDSQFFESSVPRSIHIHTSLLAGLSLIMIGALHRINAFQTFTILYTGRRDKGVRLETFLKMDQIRYIFIGMIIATTMIIIGFLTQISPITITGGISQLLLAVLFGIHLLRNHLHYQSEIDQAIPYWLKQSEYNEESMED